MHTNKRFDHSGWTPHTLALLTDLAARLPFEEAALVASNFGLAVSKSELERLTAPIASACREQVMTRLVGTKGNDSEATAMNHLPMPGRVMVLEVDGVRVLEKPELGACSGVEIKMVTLYAQQAPDERLVISDVRSPGELKAAIEGLIVVAGLTPGDTLVGIGDGAAWVEDILDTFCSISVTDCFHAAAYVELVMLALGWEDSVRASLRRSLCRGEINVGVFLSQHLPAPEVWLGWDDEALTALRYLEQRAARMTYPAFKQQGFPIGSGVVEGLNKSVIGTRMKRSGMQWSRPGAARMDTFGLRSTLSQSPRGWSMPSSAAVRRNQSTTSGW